MIMKIGDYFTVKWIAAAVALVGFLLLFLTGQVKRASEAGIIKQFQAHMTTDCNVLAVGLEDRLTHYADAVTFVASFHRVQYMEFEGLEEDVAAYTQEHSGIVRSLFITDTTGKSVFATSPVCSCVTSLVTSKLDWLSNSANQGKARAIPMDITDPELTVESHTNASNRGSMDRPFHVIIISPVFQTAQDKYRHSPNGALVGIVGIEIELDPLIEQTLKTPHFPSRTLVSILDSGGRFIYANEETSMKSRSWEHGTIECSDCHR